MIGMHRQRQETTLSYLMVVECVDAFSLASHISETCCIHNNNPQALIDVTLIAWRLAQQLLKLATLLGQPTLNRTSLLRRVSH